MTSSHSDSEWDKSTSEIQSEDSDALYTARPNRWRGPPQSWRTLTEEDRLTATALDRLRNQDLSVHLYNAFALRYQPREQYDAGGGGGGGVRPWAPPKRWTAWPLPRHLVPPDDFMKRTEDEDEAFTFRRVEREMPGARLEEVVSAAVLRCAKEKFRKRGLDGEDGLVGDEERVKRELVSSGNESVSSELESDNGEENHESTKLRHARGGSVERTYKPAIATDDDASYALIRPSTRAILSQLDQTLTILHNSRVTSSRNLTDTASASSASDTEDDIYTEAAPARHRSRSRASKSCSRSRATSIASSARSTSHDASSSKPKSNRGRKATSVPREGESEQDFLRRRAREQKKRVPVFTDGEDGGTTTDGARPPRQTRIRSRRRGLDEEVEEYWVQKKLGRFNLRDWSDVMGAAALAGFDPKVIERATQRCANLFGQGMEMHTIDEDARVETRRYVPGQVVLSSEPEEKDEDTDMDRQSRAISRQPSQAQSRAVSLASGSEYDDDDERDRRRMDSARKRQRRSSSRGSILEACYCHYAGCERATRSFDKPFNLRRHLRVIHGDFDGDEVNTGASQRTETTKQARGESKSRQVRAPKAEMVYYCTHADCERATRPFDKGHNFRRHMEHVHGEGIRARSKPPAAGAEESVVGQFFCQHAGCDRATRAFDRPRNLRRHLRLVHDGESCSNSGEGSLRESDEEAGVVEARLDEKMHETDAEEKRSTVSDGNSDSE